MNQAIIVCKRDNKETVQPLLINGMEVNPASPVSPEKCVGFIDRNNELAACMVAWNIKHDLSQLIDKHRFVVPAFRLEGPAGAGKTALVYELSRRLELPLYLLHGHDGLTPEDLSFSLIPSTKSRDKDRSILRIQAGALATALIKGGIFFFDEINRAPERVLAQLVPVLDERRALYSSITGTWIELKKDNDARPFLFCCALDPSIGRLLPDYLIERTSPSIKIGYLNIAEMRTVKESNITIDEKFIEEFKKQNHKGADPTKTIVEVASHLEMFKRMYIETEVLRLLEKADQLRESGDIELALQQMEELLLLKPNNDKLNEMYIEIKVPLLEEQSTQLWASGDIESGIKKIEEALLLKPDNPHLYNSKGNLLFVTGRYKEAFKWCERALKIDPTYGVALATQGDILVKLGDLSTAKKKYKMASKCDLSFNVTADGKNYQPFEDYLKEQLSKLDKLGKLN